MQLPENRATRALTRRWMLIGIGALVAALIVVDVVLATDEISGNTWSELVRIAGEATIVVPWLLGLVMGHWFHPFEHLAPAIEAPGNALVLLAATAVVAAIGVFVHLPMWLAFVVAAPVGAWLWPVSTDPEAMRRIRKAVA